MDQEGRSKGGNPHNLALPWQKIWLWCLKYIQSAPKSGTLHWFPNKNSIYVRATWISNAGSCQDDQNGHKGRHKHGSMPKCPIVEFRIHFLIRKDDFDVRQTVSPSSCYIQKQTPYIPAVPMCNGAIRGEMLCSLRKVNKSTLLQPCKLFGND